VIKNLNEEDIRSSNNPRTSFFFKNLNGRISVWSKIFEVEPKTELSDSQQTKKIFSPIWKNKTSPPYTTRFARIARKYDYSQYW